MDIFDLLKMYAQKDKNELYRIARNAINNIAYDVPDAVRRHQIVALLIQRIAWTGDVELTVAEYEFFNNVSGFQRKSFDEFKHYCQDVGRQYYDVEMRLYKNAMTNWSMKGRVALLQVGLCLCAIDRISPFEPSYMRGIFPYEVIMAHNQYAQM